MIETRNKIKMYCDCCGEMMPVIIHPIQKDDVNPKAWGDITCTNCSFIVATCQHDEDGIYDLIKIDEVENWKSLANKIDFKLK